MYNYCKQFNGINWNIHALFRLIRLTVLSILRYTFKMTWFWQTWQTNKPTCKTYPLYLWKGVKYNHYIDTCKGFCVLSFFKNKLTSFWACILKVRETRQYLYFVQIFSYLSLQDYPFPWISFFKVLKVLWSLIFNLMVIPQYCNNQSLTTDLNLRGNFIINQCALHLIVIHFCTSTYDQ